jgi:twitching motility protein PilJ
MFGLNRLNIGPRLGWMLAIQFLVLVAIGAGGIYSIDQSSQTIGRLALKVERVVDTQRLLTLIERDLMDSLYKVNIGALTWEEGRQAIDRFEPAFETGYDRLLNDLVARGNAKDLAEVENARTLLGESLAEVDVLFDTQDRGFLEEFLINDADFLILPMMQFLRVEADKAKTASDAELAASIQETNLSLLLAGAFLFIALLLAVGLGILVTRSIVRPVARIAEVVGAVGRGDTSVRTGIQASDEIGQLGKAFDTLLDERMTALARAEHEAEELNDSVIALLRAVSTLSERDLTVQVPVTEDATGPVADAINQMASETAEVLKKVRRIAEDVEHAAAQVNAQATIVNQVGARQREEVEATVEQLGNLTKRLNVIAETARRANKIADVATKTTKDAATTVQSSMEGMGRIRETIQETGKRIKRLGERTQEISGIVDVINGIAERTTVLALNASMQAASAGEAGRGFAVVADEVQRLAESSRKATEQIATLVKNIVAETNDTMSVMDRAIGQVVAGSEKSEEAANQMAKTVQTTDYLVSSVDEIAAGTEQQAKLITSLRDRADAIRAQTEQTGTQMIAQLEQTQNLAEYANRLVSAVSVFKLPS